MKCEKEIAGRSIDENTQAKPEYWFFLERDYFFQHVFLIKKEQNPQQLKQVIEAN